MLAAAERIVCSRGVEQLTATGVTSAAAVSRTTFYATFADREDCLLALFDEVAERFGGEMLAAYTAEGSWLDGVRSSLRVLLASLDSEPNLARFMVIGGVSGDSPLIVRRRRVLSELARGLEAHSPDRASREATVPFGSQALVSGAASIVHSRLIEDPVPVLSGLAGSLMAMLVLPFVGEGVARRELARRSPAPESAPTAPRAGGQHSVLSAARMTERTAGVLNLIASTPGISNRSLAHSAGNIDEGQISKLLARLSDLGLISNDCADSGPGRSNAWRLTRAGSERLAALP